VHLSRDRRDAERLSLTAAHQAAWEKEHSSINRQSTADTERCQSGEGEEATTCAP